MIEALQVLRSAFGDLWDHLLNAVLYNLMWLVLCLLIVPAPPATVALFYVANQTAHRRAPVYVTDYLRDVRRLFGVGWRWGVVNAGVLFVLVGDIVITGRIEGSRWASTGQMLFVALLAGWILVQLYALPLLFEQEQLSVRLALRNAAIMLIRNPAFSVVLGALVAFLLVISTLLVILTALAGGMFVALAGNHAVLSRLPDQRTAANRESL